MKKENHHIHPKAHYPGRTKSCNIIPDTDGCKKAQKNGAMQCKHCAFNKQK